MIAKFLEFELDEGLFELRAHGKVVPTQARVFAMIAYLLHARSRVVGKQELMTALWKDSVVSETAISQVIMLARKALRDESAAQRVIKTVRGRGFRFIAEVAASAAPRESLAPIARASDSVASSPPLSAAVLARSEQPLALSGRGLLGRGAELSMLRALLAQASAQRGGLVLIGGEPGIGKTSLCEAFASEALQQGHAVSFGRAWEEGGAPAFWPWIQVLRHLQMRHGVARLREWLGPDASELAALLPELAGEQSAAASSTEPAAKTPPPPDPDGTRVRFRQFDALTQLLRRVSRDDAQPGRAHVIVLEDLHAVDDASLQLLRFVLPELRDLRLLVVATFRDLEVDKSSSLRALVDQPDDARQLLLRGLSEADAASLLERKLGRPAPSRFVAAMQDVAAGNPLLLGELCTQLSPTDTERWHDLSGLAARSLPERVASAVRKQLEALPQATRAALTTACALGREFSLVLLATLHQQPETELLRTLEPALQRGVLRSSPGAAGHLLFSHALVCRAVYLAQAGEARVALHRRIAEALEARPEGSASLYEIAHHYYLAAAAGCRRQAIDYAQRAALEAQNMHAHEVAAALHERALQLAELEGLEPRVLHDLLCTSGNAWYRAGELTRASSQLDRAAQLALAVGDGEGYAWAVIFAATTLRMTLMHDRGRQASMRKALSLLPPGDSSIRAFTMCGSILDLRSAHTMPEREAVTRAAVDMARRLGDNTSLQWTLNARHYALWGAVDPAELIEIAHEMFALAQRTENYELMLDSQLWRMTDYCEMGEIDLMLQERRSYTELVEQYGSPWHRYMAFGTNSFDIGMGTSLVDALETSERVMELGKRVREPLAEPFHAVRVLFLKFHLGIERSESMFAPACVPLDYRCLWALAQATSGAHDAARAELRQTLLADDAQQLADALRRPTLSVMALVCIELGDCELARELYARLLPEAARHALLQAWVYLGPVSLYLGMLARLLGEHETAVQHLSRALNAPSHVGVYKHYTQYEHAMALAAHGGECSQVLELLGSAAAGASALGMQRLQRQSELALKHLS